MPDPIDVDAWLSKIDTPKANNPINVDDWLAKAEKPPAGSSAMRDPTQAERYQQAREYSGKWLSNEKELGGFSVRDIKEGWIPVGSQVMNAVEANEYGEAKAAFERDDNSITDKQMGILARRDVLDERKARFGTGREITGMVAQAPAFVAENFGAGKLIGAGAKVLGLARTAPIASQGLRAIAANQGVGIAAKEGLKRAGITAVDQTLRTPFTPSSYVEQSIERAKRQGGQWYDAKNVVPALFYGAAQNVVMGHSNQLSAGKGLVKRVGIGAPAMIGEMQVADALYSKIENTAEQYGMDKKWKMETNYGTIGLLLDGKSGEALKKVAMEGILGGLFAAFHGGKRPDPLPKLKDALDSLHKDGVPAEQAGQILQDALAKPPETIPEGPVRTFVEAQQKATAPESPTKPVQEAAPEVAKPAVEPEKATETKPQEAIDEPERRELYGEPPGGVERRRFGLKFEGSEPLTEGRNNAEKHAIDKYGKEGLYRVKVNDAEGKEVADAIIKEEGKSLIVPWLGKKGASSGEGKGKDLFGTREITALGKQLAETYPDMDFLKYQVGNDRNAAGEQRIFDLNKYRTRLAKRAEKEAVKEPADFKLTEPTDAGGGMKRIAAKGEDGKEVGAVEYFVDQDGIRVGHVGVESKSQRQGLATRLYDEMKRLNPGLPIRGELRTESGDAFRKKYDAAKPDEAAQPVETVPEKPGEGDVTGLRKDFDDAERARLNQPPALEADPVGHSFPELRQKALEIAKTDPERHRRLADELIEKPRHVDDTEAMLLLRRAVELNVTYKQSRAELEAARASGDPARIAEATIAEASALGRYMDVRKAARETGAEQGRGLNAWKLFAKDDFTLVSMIEQKKNAKGDRFTEADKEAAVAANKEIEALQAKVDALEANQRRQRVEKATGDEKKLSPRVSNARKEVDAAWDNLRKLTKGKFFSAEAAAGEAVVATARLAKAYAKLGFAKFADFVAEIKTKLGKPLKPEEEALLQKGFDQAHVELAAERRATAVERMKGVDPKDTAKLGSIAKKLYKDFALAGLDGMDARIDAVHEALKQAIPDITREQTMDAISGYGVYRQLTKAQLEAEIRDQKGQMQQLAKLRDMEAKQAPKKTGFEQREPSAVERELIKKVNEKKKELGYDVTDPETQLKSAMDSAKTRMKNDIESMTKQIEKGEKAIKKKTNMQPDAELTDLKAKRDALKAEYEAKFRNPEAEANARLAKYYADKIAELEGRIKAGDFADPVKREAAKLTPENMAAKAKLAQKQNEWYEGNLRERAANRTKGEKAMAIVAKWYRGSILSSPITLAKLSSAAFTHNVVVPMQNLVGAGFGKVFPKLAAKASLEGQFSARVEAKAFVEGYRQWMKDAASVWKTGDMDIGHLYGKQYLEIDPSFADFFGRIHYMLKTPAKRNAFERAMAYGSEAAIKEGLDVTDPAVQMRLGVEAYKMGDRAIFQNDNVIVDMYKRGINYSPTTKFIGNMTLPIVRVPTNIVLASLNHAFGSFAAPTRLAYSKLFKGGIEKLSPDQADSIMRQFKQGSTGLALLAMGYYMADDIGGYYDPHEKRDKDEPQFMEVKVLGKRVPAYLLHSPPMEVLQLGATIRRASDKISHGERQGEVVGTAKGLLGLVEETPFVREMSGITKAAEGQIQNFLGAKARSYVVPQGMQWLAGNIDKETPFNPLEDPIKRKSEKGKGIFRGIRQEIQKGLPGLRNKLPEK